MARKIFSVLCMIVLSCSLLPINAFALTQEDILSPTFLQLTGDPTDPFDLEIVGNTLTLSHTAGYQVSTKCDAVLRLRGTNSLADELDRQRLVLDVGESGTFTFTLPDADIPLELNLLIRDKSLVSTTSADNWSPYIKDILLTRESGQWRVETDQEALLTTYQSYFSRLSTSPAQNLRENIPELVRQKSDEICAGITDDYQKLKAIYHWVCSNIVYNYDFKTDFGGNASEDVLTNGTGICAGYSELCQDLLRAQNIRTEVVNGSSTGLFGREGHVWNVALINDRPVLFDATFGSSGSHNSTDFTANSRAYFDIAPASIIQDHWAGGLLSYDYLQASDSFVSQVMAHADGDDPSQWAQKEVISALLCDIVPPQVQDNYQQPITRQDFCSLILTTLRLAYQGVPDNSALPNSFGKTVDPHAFSDTDHPDVLAAYALGIVNGKEAGRFDPNGSITRQEAACMLARTAKLMNIKVEDQILYQVDADMNSTETVIPVAKATFSDQNAIASWAANYVGVIGAMTAPGNRAVMGGVDGGRFDPQGLYTREQAICTALRLYDVLRIK